MNYNKSSINNGNIKRTNSGIPPVQKPNKRSKSTHMNSNSKEKNAPLKIQNTYKQMNQDANIIISNINKKAQTPHIELNKKISNYTMKNNQSTQNSKNKKIMFSQLQKAGSIDNYLNQYQKTPSKQQSNKAGYNTINYNQTTNNYINQMNQGNATQNPNNNSSVLKKYLTAQSNNIHKVSHQRSNSGGKYMQPPLNKGAQYKMMRNRNQNKSVHNCTQFSMNEQQQNFTNNNVSQGLMNDTSYDTFINTSTINKYIQQSSSQKINHNNNSGSSNQFNYNSTQFQQYNNNHHNRSSNSKENLLYNNTSNSGLNIQQQQHQKQKQNSLKRLEDKQQLTQQQQEQEMIYQRTKKYFLQGKKYFKANQLDNAIECFQQALSIDQNHLDSMYLIAVSYLSIQDYNKAIKQFNALISKHSTYKSNVYLLLSIAYKKKNDVTSAIKMLGLAIDYFPHYYDAYIYRGKLLVKLKQYEKALYDFDCSINLDNRKALGFIGKGDCLRALGNYAQSIQFYDQAINIDKHVKKVALLKRAIAYSENNQVQEALGDLCFILEEDPCNSEACFFKGVQYQKMGNVNEAILAFEQSIKHYNSKKAVSKSLYEIAKIRIDQRDFYQAFYTLQRADYLDVDQELLKPFRVFSDAVTYLMKRKYNEGVENLNTVIKLLQCSKKNSIQNSNSTSASNFNKLNETNMQSQLYQGDKSDTEQTKSLLKGLVYPYRAYGLMCLGQHQKAYHDILMHEQYNDAALEESSQYNKMICQGIIAINEQQYEQGFEHFKKAGSLLEKKMEPVFYKAMGICHQAFHKYDMKKDKQKIEQLCMNALLCLEKAEQMNNSNASLFYARCLIFFALGNKESALKDIETAIDKSETNTAEYFYIRGLIQASELNYQAAQGDFSIAINLDEKFAPAYINRAKCLQLVSDRNAAFNDLQKYIQLKADDNMTHVWAGNLLFNIGAHEDAVKAYTRSGNTDPEIIQYRINCYVVSKELNQALGDMQKLIEIGKDMKVLYDYNCLSSIKKVSQCNQKDIQSFIQSYKEGVTDLKMQNKAAKQEKKITEGVLFKRSDLKFYQGLYYFYLGEYEKAFKKFNRSIEYVRPASEVNEDQEPHPQAEYIEEYKFENLTYNIYEFQYNMAICYIMEAQLEEAVKILMIIKDVIPEEDRKNLQSLIQSIENEMDPEYQSNPDEIEIQPLEIFSSVNRLCSIFPAIMLPLEKSKIEVRLSFCLPRVKAPSLEMGFDSTLLEKLQPSIVENKPEAPWIKKSALGLVFTDNILEMSEELLFTETKRSQQENGNEYNSDEKNDEYITKQEQEEISHAISNDDLHNHNNNQEKGGSEEVSKSQYLKQLKQNLQLDAGINDKLNKILKQQ